MTRPAPAWLRPALGIAVFVATAGITVSMAVSSIAFAAATGMFFLLAYYERAAVLRPNGLEWFFLAWIVAVALMVLFAQWPISSLSSAKRVMLIAVVYYIPAAFGSRRDISRFLLALVALTALQSVAGIVQHFISSEERLGFFQHYMTGGGIRMIVLLMALPMVFERHMQSRQRWLLAGALGIIFFALLLTQTRSSWLALGGGVMLLAILRYRVLLPVIAVAAVLFLLLSPQHYREKLTNMFSTSQEAMEQAEDGRIQAVVQSNQSRLRMWSTGWEMFLDNPVFGVGDGEMHEMYRERVPNALKGEGGHLHNTYIQVLATHGAVGVLALLAMFVAVGRSEWRQYRNAQGRFSGTLALGAFVALLGVLANGMAEYNFGDHEIAILLWTTVGLMVASSRLSREEDETIVSVGPGTHGSTVPAGQAER